MSTQASDAIRIQGQSGVMGVSRLRRRGGGRPRQTDGLLVVTFRAFGLGDRALDLETSGEGVGGGGVRPTLRRRETARAEAERIPVEAQAPTGDEKNRHQDRGQHPPAQRGQGPEQDARAHGKTFRSSSKCGPSRRLVQSPPQTMAVPCRAAAALKAAAMRGYSGQSQRT